MTLRRAPGLMLTGVLRKGSRFDVYSRVLRKGSRLMLTGSCGRPHHSLGSLQQLSMRRALYQAAFPMQFSRAQWRRSAFE
jgi:hypothetical protein